MKKVVIVWMMLVGLGVGWAICHGAQTDVVPTGSIKVVLEGFKSEKGQVVIGLGNSKETFLAEGKECQRVTAPIKGKKAAYTFKDLPYGDYAFVAFHDENNDGKLDMNGMGMPTERLGFSNNARGVMGPADWKDAKFALDKPSVAVTVRVR